MNKCTEVGAVSRLCRFLNYGLPCDADSLRVIGHFRFTCSFGMIVTEIVISYQFSSESLLDRSDIKLFFSNHKCTYS